MPTSGCVSLAVQLLAPPPDPNKKSSELLHSGLLIDEWVERIPSANQTTGVAFHYNQPTPQAPQTLLLAVWPPIPTEGWTDSDSALSILNNVTLSILNETLDLAKIRTVNLANLQEVGSILPALYFAFNPDGQTISIQVKTPPPPALKELEFKFELEKKLSHDPNNPIRTETEKLCKSYDLPPGWEVDTSRGDGKGYVVEIDATKTKNATECEVTLYPSSIKVCGTLTAKIAKVSIYLFEIVFEENGILAGTLRVYLKEKK